MRFKSMHIFNLALLGKQARHLISYPESLISRILKAKYYPNGDFLSATLGHNPSYSWRSIWSVQHLIKAGYRWKIGNGLSIPVWDEPWLKNNPNSRCTSIPRSNESHNLRRLSIIFLLSPLRGMIEGYGIGLMMGNIL
uniref:Uncharacterized protein n=1 Tax=Cajanus cajan TaxID=3821 RepID=A0A151S2D0_CAJCA|nr:hypothetical protein KK1_029271 [Cajanus cajan]